MPPFRRFTILDAMAFVAASAVGLSLSRWVQPQGGFLPVSGARLQHWVWGGPPSCIAVAWGFVLLLIRLRAPRPRWRRLIRQPGFVASLMTVGPIPIGILLILGTARILRESPLINAVYTPEWYWGSAIEMIPSAIGGAWLALALSKRWWSEPTWVDLLGRGLGLFWLVSWPVHMFLPFLKYAFPSKF